MSTEQQFSEVKPIIERLKRKYGHQIPTDDIVQICLKALLVCGSSNLEPGLACVVMESDLLDEIRHIKAQKRSADFVELTAYLPALDASENRIITEDAIEALYIEFPDFAYNIQDLLANESLVDYTEKATALSDSTNRPVSKELIFKIHGLTVQNGRTLLERVRAFLKKQGYRR